MHTRILVALDGSTNAEHALPAAAALSRLTHAPIDLVRVHEVSPSASVARGRWDEMSRRHELEGLCATAARLLASGASTVDVALVDGRAPDAILREIAQRGTDLVVMTDRGRSPSRSKCLGSVSTTVMRHAHVPVLMMRTRDDPADLSHGPIFRNVLLAVDDPESDTELLRQAVELGRLGGGCRLWQIAEQAVNPLYPYAYAGAAVRPSHAYSRESGVFEQPSQCGWRIPNGVVPDAARVEIVVCQDPAAATLRALAANTFDLVAIPSNSDSSRLGIGSLVQRVASASRMPIFICPTSMLS